MGGDDRPGSRRRPVTTLPEVAALYMGGPTHHRRELHTPPAAVTHEVAVTRPLRAWAIA